MPMRPLKSPIVRHFAFRLREMRLARGLSQEGLADKANLHRTYVGSVERGERNISLVNVERLAKALGMSVSELLCEVDAKN